MTNTNQEAPAARIWPHVAASHMRLCVYYYSHGQEMNLSFHMFEQAPMGYLGGVRVPPRRRPWPFSMPPTFNAPSTWRMLYQIGTACFLAGSAL